MNTLKLYIAVLFSIFTIQAATAQTKTETIKVWGNCGMCKAKIEKAAKGAGAAKASWNEDTQQLNVAYDAKKTSSQKIQQSIANTGYDTQDLTASDKAYKALPGCCQYDRKHAVPATADSTLQKQ